MQNNQNENLISIVLPVYNGAKIISRSIDSVLNQTYKNFELIIVNDCSTDNTLDIINEYSKKDNRIKIINNEVNLKLPSSLNRGFSNAKGDYFTWTSDDNMYHKDALEKMLNAIILNNAQFVYADYNKCDINGNIKEFVKCKDAKTLTLYNNIGACFLYSKELAKKVGEYNKDIFLAEDYDYWIRCYKETNCRFYYLQECLYDYAIHENSLSSTRRDEVYLITYKLKMSHFDFLYSICDSDKERFIFFDMILYYITDYEEMKKVRKTFYIFNKKYMIYDLLRRVKNKLKL